MSVRLTLREDGDIEIEGEQGMTFPDIAFIIGLGYYKINMSYFGMVMRAAEAKRQEEAKAKPNLFVPR
jgi:hypothetical protein